jgi:hypothetical protein
MEGGHILTHLEREALNQLAIVKKKALPNDTNVERSRCDNHVDR